MRAADLSRNSTRSGINAIVPLPRDLSVSSVIAGGANARRTLSVCSRVLNTWYKSTFFRLGRHERPS